MNARLLAALLAAACLVGTASAQQPDVGYGGYPANPWHSGYYHTTFRRPVPLVVPPTVRTQTNYGWGIGNTRVTYLYQQFEGPYNGYPYEGWETWRPQPFWPTDTLQFGVYYIRGPW